MAQGTSRNNVPVNLGDQVSILGAVVSVTGSAPSTASILVNAQNAGGQFTCQANDCTALQHTTGAAMSMNGKLFDAGDRVTVNGRVTAISGSGLSASLTVLLDHSGMSVTVLAGSVQSNGA